MGLHCLCAAPHQEIGLTAMQGPYDIIQLLRLRFRHLAEEKHFRSAPRLRLGSLPVERQALSRGLADID